MARRRPGRPVDPIPRERLLESAAEAFAELGYVGASMSKIAARVGMRKSSLFHHFASKDALYDEVFSTVLDGLDALLASALATPGGFELQLDRLSEALTEHLGENPAVARLLLRELTSRGPVLDRPGRARIQTSLAATAAFLETGMTSGVIARQDPAHLALSVVGMHLTWFAAPEVSSAVTGLDVFDPRAVSERTAAISVQVRRMCGIAPRAIPS